MAKRRQIYSKNDMFKGKLVDMPLKCKAAILNAGGEYVYKCPRCGHMATEDQCDVFGAEPGQALVEAIAEAQRFILRAAAARVRIAKENGFCASSKETAAAKRASLDLSRALSALRKRGAM